jgi:hypothetical protein
VCIVNQRFVKEYLPGADPIGRHVGMGSEPGTKIDIEIAGVVRDFKYENMREVIVLVAVGVGLGLAGSLALTRLVRAQLFGITPWDPGVIAFASAALSAVALWAGFLPARAAAHADPVHIPRHE